jgi:hypothetical protein
MRTVSEIERAIEKLAAPELTRLARWIFERDNESWDRQMDEDAASGKLGFLVNEAKAARKNKTCETGRKKNS